MTIVDAGGSVAGAGRVRRSRRKRWFAVGGAVLLLVCVLMHMHVVLSAAAHTFAPADAPRADCIVVPGARIHADGTPYDLLTDRLAAAAQLFAAGKAPRIVLSGRGGGELAVDEVGAMRRWLVERGVPAAALVDDPLGLRTLDTMRQLRGQGGIRSAIVVTNPFHVARSVFLGRSAGLDVCGVEAPYLREYPIGTVLRNESREAAARVWAWIEVLVLGGAR